MYVNNRPIVLPGMKVSEMILSNPYLMLMLEYFGIELVVHEKTVDQVCREHDINIDLFLKISNLFNGYNTNTENDYTYNDIKVIISFLSKSHNYYLKEKFPKIRSYIEKIFELNDHPEIEMVEQFFNEYSREVTIHLEYESTTVFPYVLGLYGHLKNGESDEMLNDYSSAEFKEHHDNIEEKLTDLKNLLIKYLPQKRDQGIRRKLLFNLFELEYDLNIHAQIENSILIPLVEQMEQQLKISR